MKKDNGFGCRLIRVQTPIKLKSAWAVEKKRIGCGLEAIATDSRGNDLYSNRSRAKEESQPGILFGVPGEEASYGR